MHIKYQYGIVSLFLTKPCSEKVFFPKKVIPLHSFFSEPRLSSKRLPSEVLILYNCIFVVQRTLGALEIMFGENRHTSTKITI